MSIGGEPTLCRFGRQNGLLLEIAFMTPSLLVVLFLVVFLITIGLIITIVLIISIIFIVSIVAIIAIIT